MWRVAGCVACGRSYPFCIIQIFLTAEDDGVILEKNVAAFRSCVDQQAQAILDFEPDAVLASSFGGLVCLDLLEWTPGEDPRCTVLIAAANDSSVSAGCLPKDKKKYALPSPHGPVVLIHGSEDTIISPKSSRELAAGASNPSRLLLVELKDDYGYWEFLEPMLEPRSAREQQSQ